MEHANQPGTSITNVAVRLVGEDGNAFNVLGETVRAMKKAGVERDLIQQYVDEATRGDYDHLLRVTLEWVNVE